MAESHRSTSLCPDVEEIDRLISQHPSSGDKIFRKAGYLSGYRIIHDWRRGKSWPRKDRLEDLAVELGVQVKQIILNDIPIPEISDQETPKFRYRMLVLDALHSREFLNYSTHTKMEQVDVGEFVSEFFRTELYDFPITPAERDQVHFQLCRMGWLQECPLQGELGNQPRFTERLWSDRQIWSAFESRVEQEQSCVRYAMALRDEFDDSQAQQEFNKIVAKQHQILNQMRNVTELLRQIGDPGDEQSEILALELITLDRKFHQGWAGYDPTKSALMALALSTHQQGSVATCRCTTTFAIETKKTPNKLPDPCGVHIRFLRRNQ
ncbi:hypothetical protein [Thalassoglobus sp.]|uniref:hypothetical protein n=1 Tax=Thalassoglobus sp. TaxID=2795869 RepID=UPI003AA7D4D4